MSYWVFTALSMTIYLPALAGAARVRQTEPVYFPFLLLIWLGAATEITGIVLALNHQPNLILYNVYALAEWWLLLWLFGRWGLFGRHARWALLPGIAGSAWWLAEGFYLNSLQKSNAYFLIGSSLGVVTMSVLTISQTVFFESYRLWRNPKFVICLGLILFFTFSTLVEVFLLFALGGSLAFRERLYELFHLANALTNLVFAYCVLCIPTRLQFIGPSG